MLPGDGTLTTPITVQFVNTNINCPAQNVKLPETNALPFKENAIISFTCTVFSNGQMTRTMIAVLLIEKSGFLKNDFYLFVVFLSNSRK